MRTHLTNFEAPLRICTYLGISKIMHHILAYINHNYINSLGGKQNKYQGS